MRTDRIKMHSLLQETENKYIVLTITKYNNQYLNAFHKADFQSYVKYREKEKAEITEAILKKAGYRKKERDEMLLEIRKNPTIDDFLDTYSINEYRFRIGRDGTLEECITVLLSE